MHLKIGDKVGLKHDTTSGIVTHIHQDKATIATTDGFEIICLKKDLVVYQLDLDHISKVVNKDSNCSHKSLKSNFNPIVDLHCKTPQNYKSILERQLHTFKTQLQLGMSKGVSSMTFIHGFGKGVLRKKIEHHLKQKGLSYGDASFSKYGIDSAITVYFKC